MHIALDIRPLARPTWTGIENYVFQVAAHLPHVLAADDRLDWFAFSAGHRKVLRRLAADRLPRGPQARTRLIPLPAHLVHELAPRSRLPGLGLLLGRPDVVHVSDGPVLKPRRIPLVATVFDLTPRIFPEQFPVRAREKFETYFQLVRSRARRVLVTSDSAKRDVQEHLGVPEDRISVTPLAADPRFRPIDDEDAIRAVRRRLGVPERYLLFIGTSGPRKNLGTLLEAYALLPSSLRAEVGLVLSGHLTAHAEELRRRAVELDVLPTVLFTGYLPFGELHHLLCGADAFVLPSRYEGFGLPVLEAMACGVPVIAADTASLPEVVGDAGLLVSPEDPLALAGTLERLLADPALRRVLRDRGLSRSAKFTWEETARKTLTVYRTAIEGGDPGLDHLPLRAAQGLNRSPENHV